MRKSRAEEINDTVEETLARHKKTLMDFARQQKLNIIGFYEEVISGENLYVRTEMLRLLADIEQGSNIDGVLCMDIDRLGRGVMSQQGIILETFKANDIKIITPRKIYDLNNDLDEEYTEFQSFFARRELKTINRRLRQGIIKTLDDGGYIANAPFGYEKCKNGKLPSLKICDAEAKFVKMIFNLYVDENYGCQAIANAINSMGAVARRGAPFNRTTIMTILKNPVYIGKIRWNKFRHIKPKKTGDTIKTYKNDETVWLLKDGLHPPIISTEIFEKAQEIIKGKYHAPSNSKTLSNPFAGIIVCGNCGDKMQYRPFKKGDEPYLLCQRAGCIKSTQFRFIENELLKETYAKLTKIKIETKKCANTDTSQKSIALSEIDKQITLSASQKKKLQDLLEQGVYDIDTYLSRFKKLDEKIKLLNTTKLNLSITLSDKKDIINSIKKIDDVLNTYKFAKTVDEKNQLLKSIIKKAVYTKDKMWVKDQFKIEIVFKDI